MQIVSGVTMTATSLDDDDDDAGEEIRLNGTLSKLRESSDLSFPSRIR